MLQASVADKAARVVMEDGSRVTVEVRHMLSVEQGAAHHAAHLMFKLTCCTMHNCCTLPLGTGQACRWQTAPSLRQEPAPPHPSAVVAFTGSSAAA